MFALICCWVVLLHQAVAFVDSGTGWENTTSPYDETRPLLFIGIYTAPTNVERRMEIRNTYWQDPALVGGVIEARFVVGRTVPGSSADYALQQEALLHPQEFLHLAVEDDYHNLTHKTLKLLEWFAAYSRAMYLLKLDDDSYPHFDMIIPRLRGEDAKYVQMGMLLKCNPVLNDTKWAEESSMWPYSFYPKHMQGSGYFLSADLVREVVARRAQTPPGERILLHNEDATLGVWLELDKQMDPSFPVHLKNVAATISGCQPGDLISMNNLPGYMTCYWNRRMRGEKDVCCYGPLDKLRQSFLQQGAAVKRFRAEPSQQSSVSNKTQECYSSSIPDELWRPPGWYLTSRTATASH